MKKLIIFDWGRTLFDNESNALFPETKSLLAYLTPKHVLAIVSLAPDGDFERRWRVIRGEGIEPHFGSILFTATDKNALYPMTLAKLGMATHETTIVDDRMVRGIAWGNRNGATTIWFQNGKFAHELPNEITGTPTHTIHALDELYSFL